MIVVCKTIWLNVTHSSAYLQSIWKPPPPGPSASDCWRSVPSPSPAPSLWGPWASEGKAQHASLPHLRSIPSQSLLPHSCTCQLHQTRMWLSGSVREAAPPSQPTPPLMSAMDERLSYLFIAFRCSLLLSYPFPYHPPSQINFVASRKGQIQEINHRLLGEDGGE